MGSRIQACDGIILPRKAQQVVEEDSIQSERWNPLLQKQKQNRSSDFDCEYDSNSGVLPSKPAAVARRRSRHCRNDSRISFSSVVYPRLSLLMLLVLLDNNFHWLPFSIPSAQARPEMSMMCTAELMVMGSIIPSTQTVGTANFGHQLNHNRFLYTAVLTTLPEEHRDLCDIGFLVDRDVLDNETVADVPDSPVGLMVDLRGTCDVLTKASNALELQSNLHDNLKYIIFYDGSPGKAVESEIIPELSLDGIWTQEPTWSPTTTISSEPTIMKSQAPTQEPSTLPSVSLSPSVSPSLDPTTSPTTSQAPSTVPSSGPSQEPSSSLVPSHLPSFKPSEFPTLSSQPTGTIDPTYSPTESYTFDSSPPPTPISTPASSSTSSSITSLFNDDLINTIFLEIEKSEDLEQLYSGRDKDRNMNEKERRAEEQKRNRQKQLLESNDSIVFVSVAAINAERILGEVDFKITRDPSQGSPEFFQTGNNLWDMKMTLGSPINPPPYCPNDDDKSEPEISIPPPTRPTPVVYTYVPVTAPSRDNEEDDDFFSSSNGNGNDNGRISSGTYSKNAPGSFTIFKIVLFGLLIASPCLRAIHLWWAGGGRIRFRRSSEDNSNRVIGLQYIPPMDNWFGAMELEEGYRPHARLTYQQIMNLPEIIYTTPVHSDEINDETKKASGPEKSSIEEKDIRIYIEGDNRIDRGNDASETIDSTFTGSNSSISVTSPSIDGQTPSVEETEDTDNSVNLESSFENEPTHLQFPTSPQRVSSITQASNTNGDGEIPLSPRAIVPKDDAPPDEEDQQQPQQQPLLDTPTPAPAPTPTQQQVEEEEENPPPRPLSFRTQRRMRHFTTTTCTTCSICIDEFVEGEKVRLLPRCGHAFHTECIVPWLQDRQGCCPLCKEGVLDDSSNNEGPAQPTTMIS